MLDVESSEELLARAQEYYDQRLKALLEPEFDGKLVTIHLKSGDYALADDPVAAYDELQSRGREAPYVLLRVGHPYAYEMYHT